MAASTGFFAMMSETDEKGRSAWSYLASCVWWLLMIVFIFQDKWDHATFALIFAIYHGRPKEWR